LTAEAEVSVLRLAELHGGPVLAPFDKPECVSPSRWYRGKSESTMAAWPRSTRPGGRIGSAVRSGERVLPA